MSLQLIYKTSHYKTGERDLRWSVDLAPFKVIAAQIILSALTALLCALFSSRPRPAVLSACIGGAICWVPGALFALYLKQAAASGPKSSSLLLTRWCWIAGTIIKAALAIAMFAAVALFFHAASWPALLAAYFVALKTYWIALVWR